MEYLFTWFAGIVNTIVPMKYIGKLTFIPHTTHYKLRLQFVIMSMMSNSFTGHY